MSSVPVPEADEPLVLVRGAGCAEFDGVYEPDGMQDGAHRYRKVCGGAETLNRNADGHWYLCVGHTGSWYRAASRADLPPAAGWQV